MARRKKEIKIVNPRRSLGRKEKKRFLIVCDGKETEPQYFNALVRYKRRTVFADILPTDHSGPVHTIKKAVRIRNKEEDDQYDEVWCVFDAEDRKNILQLQRAYQLAMDEKIQLAISKPCIEYWFLLHFSDTHRSFRSYNEVKKALEKILTNSYQKNNPPIEQFLSLTDRALERSRRHTLNPLRSPRFWPNPSTNVQHLVASIWLSDS